MASGVDMWIDIFLYGVSWWLVPIIIIFVYRKLLRRYPVKCVIFEKRGETLVYNEDMAGRFDDPINCYKLKIAKDTIPIPEYDWILQYVAKPTNLFEKVVNLLCGRIGTIVLFKYGSKQYKPVDAKLSMDNKKKFKEMKDKYGQPIWVTVYEPINVKSEMSRLDFEVIDWDDINHMVQEIRASIQRRQKMTDFWSRWGPPISLAVGAMILIVCGYLGYDFLMQAGDKYAAAAGQPRATPPVANDDLGLGNLLPVD